MKLKDLREQLTQLLEASAAKAVRDSRGEGTDLSHIFGGKMDVDESDLQVLDPASVQEAVDAINKATKTREGARRILAAITVAVKYAGKAL